MRFSQAQNNELLVCEAMPKMSHHLCTPVERELPLSPRPCTRTIHPGSSNSPGFHHWTRLWFSPGIQKVLTQKSVIKFLERGNLNELQRLAKHNSCFFRCNNIKLQVNTCNAKTNRVGNIVQHIQATPQAVTTSRRDNTNDKVGAQ